MPCPRLYHGLLISCVLGGLILTLPAWAKDSRQPLQFNLNQLERLLLGRNSSLEALYYQLESSMYQLEGDRLRQWPSLRVNYSYYPQDQPAYEDSVSFYEQRGEAALVYPIMDALLNRRYLQQEGQARVEEKRALLQAGQLELLRKLRRQYAAALKEKRLLGEYSQREEGLSRWLAQAKQSYYHKQSLLPEALDIEARQLTNQQLLDQHRQSYSLRLIQLAHLVGLENREWEPVPPLASPPSLPDKQSLLGLLDQHPLIRVYRLRASRDKIQLASSWLKSLKLEAEAGYIVGEDRDSNSLSGARLGLRFSIPLAYQRLRDYRQLSLLEEQKRWAAEAEAQRQELKQQLVVAYTQLEGISSQQGLAQKQIQQARERIRFLRTQMEYPLSEPEHPWQQVISAYQQQWRAQEGLIELERQWYTAYYDLLYLSGRADSPGPAAGMSPAYLPPVDGSSSLTPPQALYIENTSPLAAVGEQRFLIQFCHAKGISRILLNAGPIFALPATSGWLPEFISRLHQQGISVWASLGPYNWLAADIGQQISSDSAPVLAYNQQQLGDDAIDGLQLQLTLPGSLEEAPEGVSAGINRLLTHCRQLYQRVKALPHPLQLGLTIPYWYDQLDMQLLADSIYYADELMVTLPKGLAVTKLLEGVRNELKLGEEMGRQVWLALDCSYLAQHDQPGPEEYMEQVRSQWQHQLQFAIFDYQAYRTLQER